MPDHVEIVVTAPERPRHERPIKHAEDAVGGFRRTSFTVRVEWGDRPHGGGRGRGSERSAASPARAPRTRSLPSDPRDVRRHRAQSRAC